MIDTTPQKRTRRQRFTTWLNVKCGTASPEQLMDYRIAQMQNSSNEKTQAKAIDDVFSYISYPSKLERVAEDKRAPYVEKGFNALIAQVQNPKNKAQATAIHFLDRAIDNEKIQTTLGDKAADYMVEGVRALIPQVHNKDPEIQKKTAGLLHGMIIDSTVDDRVLKKVGARAADLILPVTSALIAYVEAKDEPMDYLISVMQYHAQTTGTGKTWLLCDVLKSHDIKVALPAEDYKKHVESLFTTVLKKRDAEKKEKPKQTHMNQLIDAVTAEGGALAMSVLDEKFLSDAGFLNTDKTNDPHQFAVLKAFGKNTADITARVKYHALFAARAEEKYKAMQETMGQINENLDPDTRRAKLAELQENTDAYEQSADLRDAFFRHPPQEIPEAA